MQGDESVIPDAASIMTNYEINKDNQWGWITLYVVTIVIAVLGNLLFIVSSLCTKRTRTTGKNFLLKVICFISETRFSEGGCQTPFIH